MLAITWSEMLFKMLDSLVELRVISLLFLNEIDKPAFIGQLSMLYRL
jgi:hypothetical protein